MKVSGAPAAPAGGTVSGAAKRKVPNTKPPKPLVATPPESRDEERGWP